MEVSDFKGKLADLTNKRLLANFLDTSISDVKIKFVDIDEILRYPTAILSYRPIDEGKLYQIPTVAVRLDDAINELSRLTGLTIQRYGTAIEVEAISGKQLETVSENLEKNKVAINGLLDYLDTYKPKREPAQSAGHTR